MLPFEVQIRIMFWVECIVTNEKQQKVNEELQLRRWQWLDEHRARPFPLPWLPLDWAESEPEEEDTVQTIRANALEQMDQYL